jgi:hypothetical protein
MSEAHGLASLDFSVKLPIVIIHQQTCTEHFRETQTG